MLKKMQAAMRSSVMLGGIAPAIIALSVTAMSIASYNG